MARPCFRISLLMCLSLKKMWVRTRLYLSVPWISSWIDWFWIWDVRNCFASSKKGMFFSGVLIPLSRRMLLVSISIVSPSIILVAWKVWVVVVSVML